jgi:hypothetical protein
MFRIHVNHADFGHGIDNADDIRRVPGV